MSVVNVKVSYIRPNGYDNLKEWMNNSENIYIGRKGIIFINNSRFPQNDSIFANPYKIGKDGTRDEIIEKYRKYITNRIKNDQSFKKQLLLLKGKTLGCWCKPEKCHGDVLLELINELM